jgi:hypothetical protein
VTFTRLLATLGVTGFEPAALSTCCSFKKELKKRKVPLEDYTLSGGGNYVSLKAWSLGTAVQQAAAALQWSARLTPCSLCCLLVSSSHYMQTWMGYVSTTPRKARGGKSSRGTQQW